VRRRPSPLSGRTPRRTLLLRTPAVAAGAVLTGLAGCGGGGGASPTCGPERREALDPSSAVHVLAGAEEPEYRTDPPTSGPHEPGTRLSGVLDGPLARPTQVGTLEAGGVLVQHRDLSADELDELRSVAADGVAVAPNPDLEDRVVATAWLYKRACEAVDLDAIRAFADAHLGNGPGADA
jgi:hypothetical protein